MNLEESLWLVSLGLVVQDKFGDMLGDLWDHLGPPSYLWHQEGKSQESNLATNAPDGGLVVYLRTSSMGQVDVSLVLLWRHHCGMPIE